MSVQMIRARLELYSTDWQRARQDVRRFVKPRDLPSLELWSREFFLNQCLKLHQPGGC